MQGDRAEDPAGADDQARLRKARRKHRRQGPHQVITDGRLVQLVDDRITTPEITMGQAHRSEREAAGQGYLRAVQGRDLQASSAQVEDRETGASRERGVGPDAGGDQAGFDLARDEGQRQAGGRADQGAELRPAGKIRTASEARATSRRVAASTTETLSEFDPRSTTASRDMSEKVVELDPADAVQGLLSLEIARAQGGV